MRVIEGIWIGLACVWFIAAARAKTTVRRETAASRLVHVLMVICACYLLLPGARNAGVLVQRFLPDSDATMLAGAVLTAAGAAVAVWARITIGSNWSGTVTVKEGHELIRKGPYRVVRHPIYSGLLLALLGTAVAIGEVRGLAALALAFGAFWWKSRTEEAFMSQTFGDRYAQYKRQVKALIPFVL